MEGTVTIPIKDFLEMKEVIDNLKFTHVRKSIIVQEAVNFETKNELREGYRFRQFVEILTK